MARACKENRGPTLVAFEREAIRIASDAEVAQLRRSEPPLPVSYFWTGRDGDGRLIISRAEAAALERLNASRKGFCSRIAGGLALSRHCGIVRVKPAGRGGAAAGSLTLEILPKLWGGWLVAADAARRPSELGAGRRASLRMLARSTGLGISQLDMTPQASANTALLDLIVRSFLRAALRVANHGLLACHAQGAAHPVVDNAYNQALLAALETSRKTIRHSSTERLWVDTRAMFASVSSVSMTAREVARLARDRENQRYGEALQWAELLLELLAPPPATDKAGPPALLFNLETLAAHHERDRAPGGAEAAVNDTWAAPPGHEQRC